MSENNVNAPEDIPVEPGTSKDTVNVDVIPQPDGSCPKVVETKKNLKGKTVVTNKRGAKAKGTKKEKTVAQKKRKIEVSTDSGESSLMETDSSDDNSQYHYLRRKRQS